MGEEKTWQGAAARRTLVACSAPTAVGLSELDSEAAVGVDLKRENHDQFVCAGRCFSFGLYFKAAIALRWRRMTPMTRAAIIDRKSASMTIAGMEGRWVTDGVEVGTAVIAPCVGGIAGNQGDKWRLLIRSCLIIISAVREADEKEWVVYACVARFLARTTVRRETRQHVYANLSQET